MEYIPWTNYKDIEGRIGNVMEFLEYKNPVIEAGIYNFKIFSCESRTKENDTDQVRLLLFIYDENQNYLTYLNHYFTIQQNSAYYIKQFFNSIKFDRRIIDSSVFYELLGKKGKCKVGISDYYDKPTNKVVEFI